jgi:hypothetical protein
MKYIFGTLIDIFGTKKILFDSIKEDVNENNLFDKEGKWEEILLKSIEHNVQNGIGYLSEEFILVLKKWKFDLNNFSKNIELLIFIGNKDRFTPLTMSEIVNKKIPHSKLYTFPEYGHHSLYVCKFEEIIQKLKK